MDATDRDIYDDIVQDDHNKTFLTERIEAMLRKSHRFQLFTRTQTLAFLGSRFAAVLGAPETSTDAQLGELLLRRVLFVHLTNNRDKYQLLVYVHNVLRRARAVGEAVLAVVVEAVLGPLVRPYVGVGRAADRTWPPRARVVPISVTWCKSCTRSRPASAWPTTRTRPSTTRSCCPATSSSSTSRCAKRARFA